MRGPVVPLLVGGGSELGGGPGTVEAGGVGVGEGSLGEGGPRLETGSLGGALPGPCV